MLYAMLQHLHSSITCVNVGMSVDTSVWLMQAPACSASVLSAEAEALCCTPVPFATPS